MCIAILAISYKGENGKPELIPVFSEEDLQQRIEDKKAAAQVSRIRILRHECDIELVSEWKVVYPTPPARQKTTLTTVR